MCTVVGGDQPFDIRWLKDGIPVTERGKYQKLDDSTVILSLRKLQLEDMGNYTCQVSNSAGTTSYTALLKVKGIVNAYVLVRCTVIGALLSLLSPSRLCRRVPL